MLALFFHFENSELKKNLLTEHCCVGNVNEAGPLKHCWFKIICASIKTQEIELDEQSKKQKENV